MIMTLKRCVAFSVAAMLFSAVDCRADELVLEFGELRPDSQVTRRLEFKHEGSNVVLLTKVVCDKGLAVRLSRDFLEAGDRESLNVTYSAGNSSGSFSSRIEIYAVGSPAPWKSVVVRGEVVDGEVRSSPPDVEAPKSVVWQCPWDVAIIDTGLTDGNWRKVYDKGVEIVDSRLPREREKYVAMRLMSIALAEAFDAAGDRDDGSIPRPWTKLGVNLGEPAESAFARFRQRVSKRNQEEADRRWAEKQAKWEAEKAALEAEYAKKREETKARREREREEREHEEARKKQEREDAERRYLEYVTWTPPEYFTEEFYEKTFIPFIAKELQIPSGDKGAEYREMLAEAFKSYLKTGRTPFADACALMTEKGAKKIDRKKRGGERLQCCFSSLFGGGDRVAVKIQDKGEKPSVVTGNIGAAKCAWDGRCGMAFRFLGTTYTLLYTGGGLRQNQKLSDTLIDKYGRPGLGYAVEWCKALEKEHPNDDMWKKCVHPFLREAFLHCSELKEELDKAIGEMP